mmetsp:Transcript_19349/g.56328  ORF Transcript_19349/g.56328 Transcript_19349/m.56328 type:complete len:318 (-) Transcript_19349:297-1250(-)
MDRTEEFQGVLDLLSGGRARVADPSIGTHPTDLSSAVAALATRFDTAQRLLERMQKLVNRKALYYADPGAEIDEVSLQYGEIDKTLEQEIQVLEEWLTRQSRPRSQRSQHGQCIVAQFKSHRREVSQHFQDALRRRTEVLKMKVRHHSQFGASAPRKAKLDLGAPLFSFPLAPEPPPPQQTPSAPLPQKSGEEFDRPRPTDEPLRSAADLKDPQAASRFQGQASPMGTDQGIRRRVRPGTGRMLSTQLVQQVDEEEREKSRLQQRLGSARSIEREIEKLGEVFRRFSAMVVEQGETLRIIDDDIEQAYVLVLRAKSA